MGTDHLRAQREPFTLTDVADLLGISYGAAKRRYHRGYLPVPLTREPSPVWDTREMWRFAVDQGTQPIVPFTQWIKSPIQLEPTEINDRPFGIEAVFEHPQGTLVVAYPQSGYGDMYDAERSDRDLRQGDVVAIIKPTLNPNVGYDVIVRQVDSDWPIQGVMTPDLARIVGGTLPYWPQGLRRCSSPDRQIATDNVLGNDLITTEVGELVGGPLGEAICSLAPWLRYQTYESACRDITLAEGFDQRHLEIRVRPIAIPEPETDEAVPDEYEIMRQPAREFGAFIASVFRERWMPYGGSCSVDHPAMRDLLCEGFVLHDRQSWSMAHWALKSESRADEVTMYAVPRLPGLFIMRAGSEAHYLMCDPLPSNPNDDAVLDLTNEHSPFLQTDEGWFPFPSLSNTGYSVGYTGTGSGNLIAALRAMVDGAGPATPQRIDSWVGEIHEIAPALHGRNCPKRMTIAKIRTELATPFDWRNLSGQ